MDLRKFRQIMMIGLLPLVGLWGCSSGDDDSLVYSNEPDTPAEYSERGWEYFASEDFDEALADFTSALGLSSSYGEAMAGQGWCRLVLATSVGNTNTAISNFNQAVAAGENENYVLAGLAAAQLASGGSNLSLAINNAGSVLNASPAFVFEHNISFDSKDLHLIRAFAYVVSGDYQQALDQGDLITDSEIDENDPTTWVVGGTTHTSFAAAALAHLHILSGQYSG